MGSSHQRKWSDHSFSQFQQPRYWDWMPDLRFLSSRHHIYQSVGLIYSNASRRKGKLDKVSMGTYSWGGFSNLFRTSTVQHVWVWINSRDSLSLKDVNLLTYLDRAWFQTLCWWWENNILEMRIGCYTSYWNLDVMALQKQISKFKVDHSGRSFCKILGKISHIHMKIIMSSRDDKRHRSCIKESNVRDQLMRVWLYPRRPLFEQSL